MPLKNNPVQAALDNLSDKQKLAVYSALLDALLTFHDGVGLLVQQTANLIREKGKENVTVDEVGGILALAAQGQRLTTDAVNEVLGVLVQSNTTPPKGTLLN